MRGRGPRRRGPPAGPLEAVHELKPAEERRRGPFPVHEPAPRGSVCEVQVQHEADAVAIGRLIPVSGHGPIIAGGQARGIDEAP